MFPEHGHVHLMALFSVLDRHTRQFEQHGLCATPVVQLVQASPLENTALKGT